MHQPILPLALLLTCAAAASAQNLGIQLDHGVDEHVDVPYDPLMVPQTGITVEAWITYDEGLVPIGAGFRWPTVARQDVTPGGESFFLRVGAADSGNLNLEFAVRTPAGLIFSVYPFSPGEFANWTHIAGTYDGNLVKIYKDGVEVAVASGSGLPLLDTGGVLRIGNGDVSVPGNETWSGQIDELRIWPFARSAEEILATKDLQLAGIAGEVLTFNLNSSFLDSSAGLAGAATGTPTFVSSPALGLGTGSTAVIGPASGSCTPLAQSLGSLPTVNNSAFTIRCLHAPPSAPGFFFISLTSLAPAFTIQGVDIHLNPSTFIWDDNPVSDGLGQATAPVPIPNDPSLSGVTVFTQFFFSDAVCGSAGFVASDGLGITIQ